ncbi:hypothetical protein K4F52_007974 [Lecanicillium sp. MT-2017a]|nr:hypothetical protein K4F52_007974 [Lecanicillium sp. MT-2017a]
MQLEQDWDDLWRHPGISLRQSDLLKLNKTDYDSYIQVVGSTPSDPVYAGILEVFHQLHCLVILFWAYQNRLRRATWPIDSFNESWGDLYPSDDAESRRMHVDHCIEALRLSLMCYSDVTPMVTKYSPELEAGIIADFDVPHKCRNFDKLSVLVDAQGDTA